MWSGSPMRLREAERRCADSSEKGTAQGAEPAGFEDVSEQGHLGWASQVHRQHRRVHIFAFPPGASLPLTYAT